MYDFAPALERGLDRATRPLIRLLHLGLGLSPAHVTWAAFGASLAAGGAFALGRLGWGLGLTALGQVLDGLDGGIARQFGLSSAAGRRLDPRVARASATAIFLGLALGEFVSLKLALLALAAVLLMTSIADRSRLDPGVKRFALYFGMWLPNPLIFGGIFLVNLAPNVIGLLVIASGFQVKMDGWGGNLDRAASRGAGLPR